MSNVDLIQQAVFVANNAALTKAFNAIPAKFFLLSPAELRQLAKPTAIEENLIPGFVVQYFKIIYVLDAKGFKTHSICRGVCSYKHLYYRIFQNPYKLLWLLQSVVSAKSVCEAYLPIYEDYLRSRGTSFSVRSLQATNAAHSSKFQAHNLIKNILQL